MRDAAISVTLASALATGPSFCVVSSGLTPSSIGVAPRVLHRPNGSSSSTGEDAEFLVSYLTTNR
jgi:hypothetical protein